MTKYSKWISLAMFLLLIWACFMPWAYYPDIDRYFTGFYSEKNSYGKQAYLLLFLCGITSICCFVRLLWLKITSFLTGSLAVAIAIKNFALFTKCYDRGFCPEIQVGLYLMLFTTIAIFIMALLPEGKRKKSPIN